MNKKNQKLEEIKELELSKEQENKQHKDCEENKDLDIREITHQAIKLYKVKKGLFILFSLIIFIGTILGVFLKKPKYESKASIMLELDQRGVSISKSDIRLEPVRLQSDEIMASHVELIQTTALIEKLVDIVGLDVFKISRKPSRFKKIKEKIIQPIMKEINKFLVLRKLIYTTSERTKLVKKIKKNLKVRSIRKTQIIRITYKSAKKEGPAIILNNLIQLYLNSFIAIQSRTTGYKLYSVERKSKFYELKDASKIFSKFKLKYNVADLQIEKDGLIKKINDLNANESKPHILSLTTKIHDLKIKRVKLITKFNEDNPKIETINKEITFLENLLLKEENKISAKLKKNNKRLSLLTYIEPKYLELKRNVGILDDTYEIYYKAAQDKKFSNKQKSRVFIHVIDPPFIPENPIGPNRLITIILGLFASLFLSYVLILTINWLQKNKLT